MESFSFRVWSKDQGGNDCTFALPCRTEEEEQEDRSVLVEVYSLSAGALIPTGISFKYWLKPAASLNGVVANDFANDGHPLVLSFDLHDEVFRVIPLPNDEFRANLEIDTLVIRGSLSLVCCDFTNN